jgi:hypothetical protein
MGEFERVVPHCVKLEKFLEYHGEIIAYKRGSGEQGTDTFVNLPRHVRRLGC